MTDAAPERVKAHVDLVRALQETKQHVKAVAACRTGLQLFPQETRLRQRLAWMLATNPQRRFRNGPEALSVARALCEETRYRNVQYLDTLAAACAETGDFESAVRHLERVLERTCHEVLNELGITNEPLLEIAMELERIALEDDYFVSKKLYPNVDFYSGIIFKAVGIPPSLFTVLFAVARTVGWVAQWNEMIEDPSQKIGRPRQLFIGAKERKFQPLHKRH